MMDQSSFSFDFDITFLINKWMENITMAIIDLIEEKNERERETVDNSIILFVFIIPSFISKKTKEKLDEYFRELHFQCRLNVIKQPTDNIAKSSICPIL